MVNEGTFSAFKNPLVFFSVKGAHFLVCRGEGNLHGIDKAHTPLWEGFSPLSPLLISLAAIF